MQLQCPGLKKELKHEGEAQKVASASPSEQTRGQKARGHKFELPSAGELLQHVCSLPNAGVEVQNQEVGRHGRERTRENELGIRRRRSWSWKNTPAGKQLPPEFENVPPSTRLTGGHTNMQAHRTSVVTFY